MVLTTLSSRHAASLNEPQAPAQATDPFGVYVHVPFCSHVCPYCDFNTYAGLDHRIPDYAGAVQREAALWSPRFAHRAAQSIFLGGGTPSLLEPGHVADILGSCRDAFAVASNAEVTMESNPNDLSEAYCGALLAAGVTRISIGAQSLDHRGLRVLGRRHEASTVAAAVRCARAAGFDNITLDFIYGWPGQTLDVWRSDLERVLAGDVGGSPPEHLSLYGLIVEPGTPMADAVHRGILTPVDDDAAAEFAELAAVILAEAGWIHYEIANWCSTPELSSRHNSLYWRNGDYAGIGAGAFGYVGSERTMNHLSPQRYINAIAARDSPVSNREIISEDVAMGETMMLGLRLLRTGVSPQAFGRRHGISLEERFGAQLTRLRDLGLLVADQYRVVLSERGALLANSVCAEFL